ncbi:GNAT family N-acetyltransferase [Solirubrum puertoriconensis]|uniref:Acetyltransferase n=1 Tax=Solirubrum puertoriconensis TaxID=1751427 RepID=A0A9X0L3P4_SOLP1|nr:GNAT family N-acetyltransferase [Solirubrum puertoriconensis]KUG06682.1 hypothetical protein ASU33_04920 [Solirubrum puertoriconensis]
MPITSIAYAELPAATQSTLGQLTHAEFGHVPIVQQYQWATPDWSMLLHDDQGQLMAFYNLVLRTVTFDGHPVQLAGLNNVITPPALRGHGYAKQLLLATEPQWWEPLGAQHGLLVCADHMMPYYRKLGWYPVEAALYFSQPDGQHHRFESNVMLRSPSALQVHPAEIDLGGLPW